MAERKVWETLKGALPNGWTAWHSLKLRTKNGYLGEGDFVLAHPERGLVVLEVKGGFVEQRGGQWYSNSTLLDPAPLDQARTYLSKLVGRLGDWRCAPPAWGAVAVFPDTEFDVQPGQDDLNGVVMGRTHLRWFAESFPAVLERALPAARAPAGDWTKRLHQLWGETWLPSLSLGTRARELNERRFDLDDAQLVVLDGLAEADRLLVQGGAGSGKTLLAAEAARRVAAEGKKVLLLCFTQPLCKWLAARLGPAGVEVETISGFAKRAVESVDGPRSASDLTDSEYWRAIYERAMDVCEPRWDAVVVDEAQDLTFEAWFVVKALAEGKRLWAFHDPSQGFWKDRCPPQDLFRQTFKLTRGRRCPAGVEALAARYAERDGDAEAIRKAGKDGVVGLVACPDAARTAEVVGAEIDRLLSQGLTPGQIGVVSLRGQTGADAVHRKPTLGRHAFVSADDPAMEERIVADSFLRWKGLEREAIVVADVSDDLTRFTTRMHIALSRALVAARIVAPGPGWPGLPGYA